MKKVMKDCTTLSELSEVLAAKINKIKEKNRCKCSISGTYIIWCGKLW